LRPQGGGKPHLRMSGIAQDDNSNQQNIMVKPWRPSNNHHAHSPSSATVPQTEAEVTLVTMVTRTVFDLLRE
jgi:hypothetical protein